METIGEYLTRLMRQKNLTAKDLATRCGLTDSYVGRLCKSQSANLTVDTIKKLAMALDVDAHEIFAVASGVPASQAPQTDLLLFLDQMQKLGTDENGPEALRQLLGFAADERRALLDYIAYCKRPPFKGKPNGKGKPRKKD